MKSSDLRLPPSQSVEAEEEKEAEEEEEEGAQSRHSWKILGPPEGRGTQRRIWPLTTTPSTEPWD